MESGLQSIRKSVRGFVKRIAAWLNQVSKGKITPNGVTLFGFIMHIPIAFLIAYGFNFWAAGLLVIFGLFDTLDGELARVQGRASARGMLLDASTDRMKEILIYSGIGFALASGTSPKSAVWAVAACGASITVSYVKAKGEAAIAASEKVFDHAALNKMFADGLMTFEIRMVIVIVGLLINQIAIATAIIAIFAFLTALGRLGRIGRQLDEN